MRCPSILQLIAFGSRVMLLRAHKKKIDNINYIICAWFSGFYMTIGMGVYNCNNNYFLKYFLFKNILI